LLAGALSMSIIAGCAGAPMPPGPAPGTSIPDTEPVQEAEAIPEKNAGQNSRVESVDIPAPSLANSIVGEKTEQRISVYLPPGYDYSDKEYPVVYFLPGYGARTETFMAEFYRAMDSFLDAEEVNEMLIVVVNGIGVLEGTFYYNSPVTGNWEDFVTKDVIQYVDSHYRTIQSAEARGLAGHSMGGFGVINIAMRTKDIFSYVYSMSPGLFDDDGLSESLMDFGLVEQFIDRHAEADDETVHAEYLEYIDRSGWTTTFSFAYASAFAPDANARAPYVKLPEKDENGDFMRDGILQLYHSGYGGLKEKLNNDTYIDNLLNLKGFVIEYGTDDEFIFIPKGCVYFSGLLKEHDIPHELHEFKGPHTSLPRIRTVVIPYFSNTFQVF